MTHSDKNRESRARRALSRINYFYLQKTPSRSWLRKHYGVGYMVLDGADVVLGCRDHAYEASLDQVEAFIEDLQNGWRPRRPSVEEANATQAANRASEKLAHEMTIADFTRKGAWHTKRDKDGRIVERKWIDS